jgi:hypothetical protein
MHPRFKVVSVLFLFLLPSCNAIPVDFQIPEIPSFNTPTATTSDATNVPNPSSTSSSPPVPEGTPIVEEPSQTPVALPTQKPSTTPTPTRVLWDIQVGSNIGIQNFAHPELGCQWMGVAGQVFDTNGFPMTDLVVEIGGSLAGQEVFGVTILGQAEAYGPGGYEFTLSDAPISSQGTVWLRVYDIAGLALSEDTFITTYEDCDKNLILLNFVNSFTPPQDSVYLPLIIKK